MTSHPTYHLETVELPSTLGVSAQLQFHRFGTPGQGAKAYIQAALHANETPGLLVSHYLLSMLQAADARGEVSGEIIVVPYANPLGAGQALFGHQLGRFFAANGKNFNRDFPNLFSKVIPTVAGGLTDDAAHNVAFIRSACKAQLAESVPSSALEAMKHALISRSIDADIVLDLHADAEAVLYMFALPELASPAKLLAAYLGCDALLLAEPSPAVPFEEANGVLWSRLAAEFPSNPIPNACMAVTVELRGSRDVTDDLAEQDAKALFSYLQARGLIDGDAPTVPSLRCEPTPYTGVAQVTSQHAGVVTFRSEPGARVQRGDELARVYPIDSRDTPTLLKSPIDGLLLSRCMQRYVVPGTEVCAIAGSEVLVDNLGKDLLSD